MGKEPVEPFGVPLGVELYVLPERNAVVLEVKLAEAPREGDTVSLAMPPDSALTLALALISSVKELRDTDHEIAALFPPVDPKNGN